MLQEQRIDSNLVHIRPRFDGNNSNLWERERKRGVSLKIQTQRISFTALWTFPARRGTRGRKAL